MKPDLAPDLIEDEALGILGDPEVYNEDYGS